jgi:hypothetical protein
MRNFVIAIVVTATYFVFGGSGNLLFGFVCSYFGACVGQKLREMQN